MGDRTNEVIPGGDFMVSNSIIRNFQPIPGNNNISKDPQFISPFRLNFRPDSLSPAINSGLNLGILKDLDDKSRDEKPDLGAYEK